MKILRPALIILATLALAAHFSRIDMPTLAVLSLLVPFLLLSRREFPNRIVQLYLWLGALEWIRTLSVYAIEREAVEQPWLRLVIILGTMVLLTGIAAWLAGRRAAELRDTHSTEDSDE